MTTFKTIAATAVIAVAGTFAAFTGLHLGQSPADAAGSQPVKAKTTYTVTMSAKQLAQLMRGQNSGGTQAKHVRKAAHRRQTTHRSSYSTYRGSNRSYSGRSYSSRSYNSGYRSGYRCYGYGNRGSYSGSHSGGCWGGGGCW